jgi:hypothetical protein
VNDLSGNGNTGTIAGATWTTTAKYGKALSFNGSGSYVDAGNNASLQMTGNMTWSAWVNAAANPPDDGMIVSKSDSTSGWQLKTSPDTGQRTFGSAVTASGGTRVQRYSSTVASLNTWYHVAGVYNAAAKTLDIYVNGILSDGALSAAVPGSQVNSGANVNIGRRSGGFYFNGIIDEVRIYNRALSQSEIQSDMNTPLGSGGSNPPPAMISLSPTSLDFGSQTMGTSNAAGISISPRATALTFTRTQQFTAANNNGEVTWLVDGVAGGSSTNGTISSTGLYTPPGAVGTHTVTAMDHVHHQLPGDFYAKRGQLQNGPELE